jgi:hypothetical protein
VDVHRLATGLALNRIAFGTGLLLSPERSGRTWIGRAAMDPGGQVFARAIGARDLALGLGALAALRGGRPARAWLAAHLVSDAADFVATWAARRSIPRAAAAYALLMAGGSTGIAAAYLLGGDGPRADAPPAA